MIEVVISAALMAMILLSGYLCLSSGLASQKMIESRGEALQAARVAMARLSADLRAACPLAKEIEFVGMQRQLGESEADNLDFGTHHYSPRQAGQGDFCQVSYFVTREPGSKELRLWRRRNPMLASDPLTGGEREEIARGLSGVRFEYSDGFIWYNTWGDPTGRGKAKAQSSWREQPNLSGLPEAVRITLWVDPEAARSPDSADPSAPALMLQTVARLTAAGAGMAAGGTAERETEKKPSGADGSSPNPEP